MHLGRCLKKYSFSRNPFNLLSDGVVKKPAARFQTGNPVYALHQTIGSTVKLGDRNLRIDPPQAQTVDLHDLHLNGLRDDGAKIDVNFWNAPDDQAILQLRRYLFDHGVKSFLPTIISDSRENVERKLQRLKDHLENHPNGNKLLSMADIPGVHIEGGYISRKGSHLKKHLRALGPEVVDDFAEKFPGLIKLWTVCPVVDKDGRHVQAQKRAGITPAYGHSHASYDEAKQAFLENDVRLVTHWGNGMPVFMKDPIEQLSLENRSENSSSFDREEPSAEDIRNLKADLNRPENFELRERAGLAKAAFDNPRVYMMAICGSDKQCQPLNGGAMKSDDRDYHISPKLINELAKTGRLILVSDAVAAKSPGDSQSGCQKRGYELGGGMRTLGTHAIRNGIDLAGLTQRQVIRAASELPQKVIAGEFIGRANRILVEPKDLQQTMADRVELDQVVKV